MTRPIFLSAPDIGEEERKLVSDVLSGSSLSFGPMLTDFESEFAERVGTRHAVGVSSGTAGLHLAVIAAGAGDGDFIITSPFSFIASANAALFERAIPLFVDIDSESLMLDPAAAIEAAERLTARKTGWQSILPRKGARESGALRAILPVHVFGRPMDTSAIANTARELQIAVIEDACEAVGASIDGKPVGQSADSAVFAFYPNKQMTSGEGGMIVTNDDRSASLFRSLRNQGRDDSGVWLTHTRLGYNYRLDEMSAAVGLAQLRRLDELLARREAVAMAYAKMFEDVQGVTPLPIPPASTKLSWFVYMIRLDDDIDRNGLMLRLADRGIPTRPYFSPIHLQPLYVERFGYQPGDFPNAEHAGRSLLAIPFHGQLSDDDCAYVVEQIRCEVANERMHRRPTPLRDVAGA